MKEALLVNIRSLLLTVLILSSSTFQALAYYHPDEGRWLSRDPITEKEKEEELATVFPKLFANAYLFCLNRPVDDVDVLGLSPISVSEGLRAYMAMQAKLEGMCKEPCCTCTNKENNIWTPCTPEECRREAGRLAGAVMRTWSDNFGKGSGKSGDDVGGYLCWDWAWAFHQSIARSNLKCWSSAQRMVNDSKSERVHFFVELRACKADKDECRSFIDDGWFDRSFFHTPPWPGSGWTLGTWSPPHGRYRPPPITPVPN